MDKKRLAARVMKIGKSRVWFDPTQKKEIDEAITAHDVRSLVEKKAIKKLPEKENLAIRKKMNQGTGRRKGAMNARSNKKEKWMIKIRGLRAELKKLLESNKIEKAIYKDLYRKSGGGFFRNKAHLNTYIERNELLKK